MAVPPTYVDLGKSARDVFTKGYGEQPTSVLSSTVVVIAVCVRRKGFNTIKCHDLWLIITKLYHGGDSEMHNILQNSHNELSPSPVEMCLNLM